MTYLEYLRNEMKKGWQYTVQYHRERYIKHSQHKVENFISYIEWEDFLGVGILVLGLIGYFYPDFSKFLQDLHAGLIAIGITVLILDNANEAIKRREEKKSLVLQMGSPDNAFAVEAVRQLHYRGWLRDGSLNKAHLGFANLSNANLEGANLSGAELGGAILSEANLEGANLSEAYLGRANLNGASLLGANLSGAFLLGANLSKANLGFATMSKAYLERANLSGAELGFANLSGAELEFTNLSGAELTQANLSGAFLLGANLTDANVTEEQLSEANLDENTTLPNGQKYHPLI